ncbi:hypothetical protein [Streptomyces sp. NPDC088178]|uniref:hypothetical protein n=1 Tax=Streptomyces sp. NPDC088178 TaxID=3365836 RepID=UPI00380F2C91
MSQTSATQKRPQAVVSSAFATPDIRPTGTDALETAEVRTPDLDMEEIRDELYAALQSIENLRHQHPYEASGYVGDPVYQPITPDTQRDGSEGNANTKTNTNFGTHTPIQAPNSWETAL